MEIIVGQKNIPISPKKARLIGPQIKGMGIDEALGILKFLPKKVAYFYSKILQNSKSVAEGKKLDYKDMYIKSLRVDKARPLKRIQYKPRGRADMITKSRSHLSVVFDEKKHKKNKKCKKR